jgi:guanylate cyclase
MRVRKITIGLVSLAVIPVNLAWTFSFLPLNLGLDVTVMNVVIGLVYTTGAIILFWTRNFTVYLNLLALTSLAFFAGLHINLGGFLNSGLLIIMSLLNPLLSSLLLSRRNTIILAALSMLVFSGLLFFDEAISANQPDLPVYFGFFNGFFTFLTLIVFTTGTILYLVGQLEEAQNRADRLLFNLLPTSIAKRLKGSPGSIADAHQEASILFADIVGFTPLTAKLSPLEMIDLLNQIYSHFDTLVEKYRVEKIRTIGDNYMVAAGVPEPHPNHAQALARMAMDMIAYSESLPPIAGVQLRFRIGINSGSLVAGVVGSKKMHYDIWGDSVNIASRMESQGVPDKIQVTQETYELLKDEFIFESRGKTTIKGKGEMQTWFLIKQRRTVPTSR